MLLWYCMAFTPTTNPGKFKLIIFEGSDWCANCQRLEKKVLTTPSFLTYMKENNIALEKVDFPQHKKLSKETRKYNDEVADRYSFDGSFPTMILSRTDTFAFSKITYTNDSPQELLDQLKAKKQLLQ